MLNLVKLQDRLKDVPTQALMSYANGANPQVPPFLALGELNRRKKMQDAAAAEQAQQMEGAPTIKDQIEQATGLMSLQNAQNPQPQAAPPQEEMPVQMAEGGMARSKPRISPEMIQKLMMLKAASQRRPERQGLSALPMRPGMFRRGDYAGGGIVAFQEGGAADVINAALAEAGTAQDSDARPMSNEQRMLMEVIKKIQDMKTSEQMRAEAGIGERPDDRAERLKALQEEQAKLAARDTVARRVLALDPMRIGKSMDEYFTRRETAEKDIASRIAEIKDLKAKADYDAKAGNVDKSRAESLEALNKQASLIKDLGELGYKDALARAQDQGKTSNLREVFKTELEALGAEGKDVNDPRVRRIAMQRAAALVATYAGPRGDITSQGQMLAQEREALKEYNDLFDPRKMLYGDLSDEMDAAKALDQKKGTGTKYQQQLKLREYNRIRQSMRLSPTNQLPGSSSGAPSGGGETPAAPAGYVIVR